MAHPNNYFPGQPPPGYPMMPFPGQPGPPRGGFMPQPMYGMPPGMPPPQFAMPPGFAPPPGFMPPRPPPQMTVPPPPSISMPPQANSANPQQYAAPPSNLTVVTPATPTLATAPSVVPEDLPEWLPPNSRQPVTMLLISLPKLEDVSEEEFQSVLQACGPISRWERRRSVLDGRFLDMGTVTWCNGLGAMRAMRLLQGIELGSGDNRRPLVLKLGKREQDIVDEAEDARKMHLSMGPMMPSADGTFAPMINEDTEAGRLETIQDSISTLLAEILASSLSDKPKQSSLSSSVSKAAFPTKEELNGMSEEGQFEAILLAEVEQFRIDQRKRDEELEKDRKNRIRKQVNELRASKQIPPSSIASSTTTPPTSTPSSTATSQPPTMQGSAPHPLANQLSGREQPEVKRVKYDSSSGASVISAAPVLVAKSSTTTSALPSFGLSAGSKMKTTSKSKITNLKPVSAFSEEVVTKRALVKIDDDDEPGEITQNSMQAESEADLDRKIAESLPNDKDALFNYPIHWDVVDQHQIVNNKLKKWITGKIIEYLGEEEKSLIDFVINKLISHSPPQMILNELKLVLEDDADVFVLKLWKILAFHSTKLRKV